MIFIVSIPLLSDSIGTYQGGNSHYTAGVSILENCMCANKTSNFSGIIAMRTR